MRRLPGFAAAALLIAGCAIAGDQTPVDRSVSPELASPPAVQLPPIVRRELSNGLQVLMVEHHELPVLDMIMLVKSGAESDPDGKEGLATLTAGLLDEGTRSRDALQIADALSFMGAELSSTSGWDQSSVSLHTTTAQLDSALAVFADVVLNPSFPEGELERLRQERLTALVQMRDNPRQVASNVFARVLFGEQHPYGDPLVGSESSVNAIARSDVVDFYSKHYLPNNSTLIVVGDFRPADLERRIESQFGAWQRGTVAAPSFGTVPARDAVSFYLVDKPGAPQSSIRIGHVGVPRATPDYFPLVVANTVLGDAFTSRLNMNLREARGFTYGAGSAFVMRESAGPFLASSEIVREKTDSAVLEFMKELRGIREPVPQEELEKAKQYVQLQLPQEFETTGQIASHLVNIALHDLPLNYYDSYAQSIGAVEQGDVQRVATAHIDPGKVAIVIVGDRKVIEPGLRALNIGPIHLRDVNGAPVK